MKSKVIEFFDNRAENWDEVCEKIAERINKILDYSKVTAGMSILDVACGTGVLIPDYLDRGVSKIVGVDISPQMIKIANNKFQDERVSFVCADAEEVSAVDFDLCMVYNALPHFENAERLVSNLCGKIKAGGRLTIAHGASRKEINECHKGRACNVSNELVEATVLKEILEKWLTVDVCVDNHEIYVVSGVKS